MQHSGNQRTLVFDRNETGIRQRRTFERYTSGGSSARPKTQELKDNRKGQNVLAHVQTKATSRRDRFVRRHAWFLANARSVPGVHRLPEEYTRFNKRTTSALCRYHLKAQKPRDGCSGTRVKFRSMFSAPGLKFSEDSTSEQSDFDLPTGSL